MKYFVRIEYQRRLFPLVTSSPPTGAFPSSVEGAWTDLLRCELPSTIGHSGVHPLHETEILSVKVDISRKEMSDVDHMKTVYS